MQNPEASVFKFIEKCYAAKILRSLHDVAKQPFKSCKFFFQMFYLPKNHFIHYDRDMQETTRRSYS